MTPARFESIRPLQFRLRKLALLLAAMCGLFAGYGFLDHRVFEPQRRTFAVERHLKSLLLKRPAGMSQKQWENTVYWTLNLHHNSLIWSQVDGPTISRFEERLAVKLAGEVDMETVHWIWDEYAMLCPGGADYQRYRPVMIEQAGRIGR